MRKLSINSLAVVSILFSTHLNAIENLENADLTGNEKIKTNFGMVVMKDNYIVEGEKRLFDEMDYQRASQAYIWSTPAVSFKQWQVAQAKTFNARNVGDFVTYSSLKEKRGIVTGNLTTPYVINFLVLKKGL